MYKKILVRAPNWIGDAVMATPALSALRCSFPEAEIVVLAKPAIAAVFKAHPDIDRIIPYEKPGKDAGFFGLWRLSQSLRLEHFDLAFLLQNAIEAALIAFFAGIPKRVGFASDGRAFLLTKSAKKNKAPKHRQESYLSLMDLVEGKKEKRPPYLIVESQERALAQALLKSKSTTEISCMIGLNPGAAYGSAKRWLPEHFAAVVDRLADQFQGQILIIGGPKERALSESIQKDMRHQAIVMTGKTTVREMMALISQCDLFISNDSGPMHIASALRIPQVAIFGPTNAKATYARGAFDVMLQKDVDCAPCRHRICPTDHRCMKGVTVDAVYEAAVKQIEQHHKLRGAVFLDRDGTINPDQEGYIDSIKRLSLFPGAGPAIAKLNRRGIPVILVTNQSGIVRGFFTEAVLEDLHRHLQGLLAREGAYLDGIYFCPHHPDFSPCECRKPKRGMIKKALRHYPIDLAKSFVVGDKAADLGLAGKEAKAILVRTGQGEATLQVLERSEKRPEPVAKDLAEAIDFILQLNTVED